MTLIEAQGKLSAISHDLNYQTEKLRERLNELNRDLSAMYQKPLQGVDFEKLKKQGDDQPLKNHLLNKQENKLKLNYFSLLCTVVQSAEKNEDAWLLLQRIASGSGFTKLERAAGAALQLTKEDAESSVQEISEASLTHAFLLDAMLLYLCCGGRKDKSLAVLETLTELFHPEVEQVRALTKAAKAIAKKNIDAYLEQSIELSPMDWPGRRYLKGLTYTSDINMADSEQFRHIILKDCSSQKQLSGRKFEHCCLERCKLTGLVDVQLEHCFVLGGTLHVTQYGGSTTAKKTTFDGSSLYLKYLTRHLYARVPREIPPKEALSHCRFLNGTQVLLNEKEVSLEKLQ